jgi:hypothetical protein
MKFRLLHGATLVIRRQASLAILVSVHVNQYKKYQDYKEIHTEFHNRDIKEEENDMTYNFHITGIRT